MPFIITDPCIETKDTACVDVCPVDCIHPRKDEPEFAHTTMLFIHPEECIDCGACVPACPVAAIYESPDAAPSHQQRLVAANAAYRNGDATAMAAAEALVAQHIAEQPGLLAVPADQRQAAHAKA
jgi:ferredoxin